MISASTTTGSPMSNMPPLVLLQTVEAVTRFGSFKRAADELLVTPSAVSHRIKSVEQALGFPLFHRVGQGIEPSEQAFFLAKAVGNARAEILQAWNEISKSGAGQGLKMCCMASFGDHFILPNIEAFRTRFPAIELEFTNIRYSDAPTARSHDLIIGIGEFPGGGWVVDNVLDLDMYLIAARGAADPIKEGRLSGPLIGYTVGSQDWREIAASVGLDLAPDAKILTFDSMVSACAAAEHGLGVALAPAFIARRMASDDRAVILDTAPIHTGMRYWFAVRRDLHGLPIVSKLRRWLDASIEQGAS